MTNSSDAQQIRILTILTFAAWFGIVAGMVEGAGLLLFQRINWANWGHTTQVSPAIIWIAPIWDFLFFVLAGLGVALLGYLVSKLPAIRVGIFLFASLMFLRLACARRTSDAS